MVRGVGVVVVLALGAGCLKPNPAYEGSDGGSGGSGGSGTGAGTSTGAGSSGGEASTGGGSGSGDASSETTFVGSTEAIGASTGSTGGTGDTGGAAFCDPALQAAKGCAPLGSTGLLFCETVTTWDDAKATCEAMCGRLAIVREAGRLAVHAELAALMTEQDKLDEMMIEGGMGTVVDHPRSSVWLGARAPMAAGVYTWVDGTPLPAAKNMFGWGPNDPDYSGLCVVLGVWGKGAEDGDYFDRGCDTEPYRFVCDPG